MRNIAVIDDGVSQKRIPGLGFHLDFTTGCADHEYGPALEDSHGTMCAAIIKKYAPEAVVGSIKILNGQTQTGFVEALCNALDWCAKNDIAVINLSLGSKYSMDSPRIREYADRVRKNGTVIVAALSNEGKVSYPASMPDVIGVRADRTLQNDEYYMCGPCIEGADVCASTRHSVGFSVPLCNSYAAPLITAKIWHIQKERNGADIGKIKYDLNQYSFRKDDNYETAACTADRFYARCIAPYLPAQTGRMPPDIPCVAIVCRNRSGSQMLGELEELFFAEGYNPVLISTGISNLPENACYVPPENLNDAVISFIAGKHESDLILLGMNENGRSSPKVSCDILFLNRSPNTPRTNGSDHAQNISYECVREFGEEDGASKEIFSEMIRLLK